MKRPSAAFLRSRFSLGAALLALILALLQLSTSDDPVDLLERTRELTRQEFDYYLSELDTTRFSQDGRREWRLQAQRLTHFPTPEFSLLDRPQLSLFPEGDEPWFIEAERARIDQDSEGRERMQLDGNVVITYVDGGGQTLTIYTDTLTVYPEQRLAETAAEVLMTTAGSELRSRGLRADLNTQLIELLANVRGYYD